MNKSGATTNTGELKAEVEDLQRQLASERIMHNALLDSLDEGLVVIGPQGYIREVNTYAVQVLGFREDELVGERFSHVLVAIDDHGEEITLLNRPMTEAFVKGRPVTAYTNIRRKDGSAIPVALTASPIIVDGRPAGAIDAFRDLTKERQLDLAKNEFVSLASHQLRTPASGVKAVLHMLASGDFGPLSDVQRKYLQRAIDSNDRQIRIIEDLLNVARADAGTFDLALDYINLAELVRAVAYEHQAPMAAKQQSFEADIPDELWAVVDGPKLEMVADNLISNAVKYTPAAGRIMVTLQQSHQEVILTVTDTGVGIAPEQLPVIFAKFGRVENELSAPADGTGLGLYLAKHLVLLHNGDITVASRPGRGSTFRVNLPIIREERPRP